MPRPPEAAAAVAAMPGAVFSRLAHKIRSLTGPVFPLHVGDTWMEPVAGARMQDLHTDAIRGLHRYGSPQGHPDLLDALHHKLRTRNGLAVEPGGVLVTSGATGGLGAAIGSVVDPGDQVLILAPFWPLIQGIVRTFRGEPVQVPFFGHVDSPETAVDAVQRHLTPRTVGLYVSSPSNPTGQVLPQAWLEALAAWAQAQGLWIFSDEVYEDYVFDGTHCSIGRFAPERTFTAFSFSKAYGMAGNRTGYVVGPADAIRSCRKVSTHTSYAAPTSGQMAGLRALETGAAWVRAARESYGAAGRRAAEILGVPPPQGSTFLFLDVGHALDARGVFGFLEDALDDGLVLAPGPSFGAGFEDHVRVCFTSAPPDRVEQACHLLAARLS